MRTALVTVGILTSLAIGGGVARATFFCTQLDNLTVGVGEIRVEIANGTDVFYANA